MQTDAIKKQFPFFYQCYLYVKESLKVCKERKESDRIHKMTNKELEELDSRLYFARQGKKLDWDRLETYTEKMQWAKLYDHDERKVMYADKLAVRQWVESKIGKEYLIPLVGSWKKFSEIKFELLPDQFVIKTNHGSGDAVIVRDKKAMSLADKMEMRRKIKLSMRTDYGTKHCEMHYSKIKPMIIAENYIDSNTEELQDYKFLCFDGVPYYCWVDVDRFSNHKRNVYDMEWKLQNWNQRSYGNYDKQLNKPEKFDEMVELVRVLSEGFSHVRVDLYNVNGKIYFGEMTFTNGSGFEEITPESADKMLGDLWKLDMRH